MGGGASAAATSRPEEVFYDEATQTLSRLPATSVPPYVDGQGRIHVRAVMRSQELVPENVRYLFRYSPEVKARWEEALRSTDASTNLAAAMLDETDGKEVRLPAAKSPWVPAQSAEGQKILATP